MNGLTMLKVTSVIVISAVLVCPIREGNTATGEDNATVQVIRSQACTNFAASFGETVIDNQVPWVYYWC